MNLLKALAAVSSMTMVSRILGLVRDTIIARVFGAGMAADAFNAAFKIPNMLRRLFAEGAFSQAFVPILGEYKNQRSEEETREFVAKITGVLGSVLLLVTAVGMLAAPLIMWISAPGFYREPAKAALFADILRVSFPYIFFISLSSMTGSVLNSWGKFSIPAFTPTFLNLSFIVFALFFSSHFDPPIMALAWAVFVGGLVQLVWQLPFLKQIGMLARPVFAFRDPAVWRVIKQMGPAIFGVSVAQISLLINSTFASFLPTGSVSWMYYADRLMEFPSGVLGVALGTILLPSLSKHAATRSDGEFSVLLDWGIRLSLLLAVPATVGLGLLSGPLLATLFTYGKFTAHDALMSQQAVIAYSFGLLGLILVKVLAPGFYARQDIKTPVRIALITLCLTQLMNLAFVFPLKHAGLALSIGLASCLNAGLLLRALLKRGIYQPSAGWSGFLLKMAVAILAMAAALLALQWLLPVHWHGPAWQRVAWLSLLVVAGAAVYFAALFALGFRPRDFMRRER
ncbi:murein biosynthesis integral membrane protein MurJ [Chromobacterium alkanivorans]|uniref:murein biosynthesis integral membrane protein MurJ n=1 Tax=Chromobacterium alkanivorans TaxID=1071719 RepID=UPI0019680430|nr:murein biosynthesis integral membrane protein MurJ [Chromobacterium alkanivorans]MBN3004381.1 murein biosynthesis integral membrane protein MurJ [Chromobacterium alkanivorans]